MQILDGKLVSQKILTGLKTELENTQSNPRLDIILVGNDPASLKYVEMKQSKAKEIGINGEIHRLNDSVSTQNVLSLIEKLNNDTAVTAYMVQLPLPPSIDTKIILEAIDPKKDADGLTSKNLGLLFHQNQNAIASATALGIIKLIDDYKINLDGKNTVIIGRSREIGQPLLALLLAKNATVTVCHSHTQNLKEITKQADILISSVGKANFIKSDFVKKNAVVVDVGLSLNLETNKLVGDVDFDEVAKIAEFITPVPGGVGPMTIAALLSNAVEIGKRNNL